MRLTVSFFLLLFFLPSLLLFPLVFAQCATCDGGKLAAKRVSMKNKSQFTRIAGIELNTVYKKEKMKDLTYCGQLCDARRECVAFEFKPESKMCFVSTSYTVVSEDVTSNIFDKQQFVKVVGKYDNKSPATDSCLDPKEYNGFLTKNATKWLNGTNPKNQTQSSNSTSSVPPTTTSTPVTLTSDQPAPITPTSMFETISSTISSMFSTMMGTSTTTVPAPDQYDSSKAVTGTTAVIQTEAPHTSASSEQSVGFASPSESPSSTTTTAGSTSTTLEHTKLTPSDPKTSSAPFPAPSTSTALGTSTTTATSSSSPSSSSTTSEPSSPSSLENSTLAAKLSEPKEQPTTATMNNEDSTERTTMTSTTERMSAGPTETDYTQQASTEQPGGLTKESGGTQSSAKGSDDHIEQTSDYTQVHTVQTVQTTEDGLTTRDALTTEFSHTSESTTTTTSQLTNATTNQDNGVIVGTYKEVQLGYGVTCQEESCTCDNKSFIRIHTKYGQYSGLKLRFTTMGWFNLGFGVSRQILGNEVWNVTCSLLPVIYERNKCNLAVVTNGFYGEAGIECVGGQEAKQVFLDRNEECPERQTVLRCQNGLGNVCSGRQANITNVIC